MKRRAFLGSTLSVVGVGSSSAQPATANAAKCGDPFATAVWLIDALIVLPAIGGVLPASRSNELIWFGSQQLMASFLSRVGHAVCSAPICIREIRWNLLVLN